MTGPIVFTSPTGKHRVVVEDDGRVCYGYLQLLETGKLVADVWLYNRAPSPEIPEWKLPDARSRMPFLNPGACCAGDMTPLAAGDLRVSWSNAPDGTQAFASLFSADRLIAELWPGEMPGRCCFAKVSSPVAAKLERVGVPIP